MSEHSPAKPYLLDVPKACAACSTLLCEVAWPCAHLPALRGLVFRIRPGHWWWEVTDGTPGRERVAAVGFAGDQAEALRLCLLAQRIESGPQL